jgi:flagellar motor switch/type III secretory pathway protein FliN
MKAYPYRLIGKRLERSLRKELEPIINSWGRDWLADEIPLSIKKIMPLFDYFQNEGSAVAHKLVNWVDDNWCGLLLSEELERFGVLLTGMADEDVEIDSQSFLLPDVAQQALIELAQRMLSGDRTPYENIPFFITENLLPKDAEHRGSGTIVVRISIEELLFDYIVSPVTVERYLKTVDSPPDEIRNQLTSLQSALGNQKLRTSVSLGSAELSLGELATIRIGDVVSLDKCINEPASMMFGANGTEVACEGYIGVKGNSLAFRISQLKDKST